MVLVDGGEVTNAQLIEYLDEVMPWGKQHVYLLVGPEFSIAKWKSPARFRDIVAAEGMEHFLDRRRSLGMPQELEVSSINSSTKVLRIEAVCGRFWWDRDQSLDEEKFTLSGAPVELRAFVQRGLRNLVIFEWDLRSNSAILQISQWQSGTSYENIRKEFFALVSGLIPVEQFKDLNLYKALGKLHALEEKAIKARKVPVARSHFLSYVTPAGTIIESRSAAGTISVLSEDFVDDALGGIRMNSTGKTGNFFWTPSTQNPLEEEVRTVIVANRNRVNFPVPNNEEAIRYVLQRIRTYCRRIARSNSSHRSG